MFTEGEEETLTRRWKSNSDGCVYVDWLANTLKRLVAEFWLTSTVGYDRFFFLVSSLVSADISRL